MQRDANLVPFQLSWSYLRYPIPKEKRVLLVKLYFHLCTTPGLPLHIIAACSDALDTLTRSRKKLSVQDVRLPWMPLFEALRSDLFLTRRQFEVRCGLRSRAHALWTYRMMSE